jgi:hypothetical protein
MKLPDDVIRGVDVRSHRRQEELGRTVRARIPNVARRALSGMTGKMPASL